MNLEDIYVMDFPEVLTDLERAVHADDFDRRSACPNFVSDTRINEAIPDADGRPNFERRLPAFGWTPSQFDELEEYAQKSETHKYYIFTSLRDMMRRRLICPSGAANVKELCDILRQEREAGTAAPVPAW